mgnify:CR=1 FL=1
MTVGDALTAVGVLLAVMTSASGLMMLILRLMLDARFAPLQKTVDALAAELREDMRRLENDVARIEAVVQSHAERLAVLDADKAGHVDVHRMIETHARG